MRLLLRVHSENNRARRLAQQSATGPTNAVVRECRSKPSGSSSNNSSPSCANNAQLLWLFVVIFASVCGLVIGLIFALHHFRLQSTTTTGPVAADSSGFRDIRFSSDYEDVKIPTLGNGHLIIDRHQWGASPSRIRSDDAVVLQHPVPHVIITHVGVQSRPCDNVYNCSIKMRTIQDAAIAEKGFDDINANFYVSNDGYVYVGRGWSVQNVYTNRSIAVCFMGDYVRYEPSARQLDGVQYLLEFGITHKHLRPDYLMIAHNQTKITKSPGINVFKHIVKWSHWYSGCGVNDRALCDW